MPFVVDLVFLRDAEALCFLPPDPPSRASYFVGITVVAELHDIIDAHTAIAIVVIVGLPKRAERIHGDLVIVTEVPRQRFHIATIHVAAESHSHAIRVASICDFVASQVNDRLHINTVNHTVERNVRVGRAE